MNASLNSHAAPTVVKPQTPVTTARRPVAQLLHALNQPLTGLQCSMEVALATPRTTEQYARGLREGLQLTERMRALVEALREVTDLAEGPDERSETFEVKTVVDETLDDLGPVAEAKNVRLAFNYPASVCLEVKAERRNFTTATFRLLESVLSLAVRGSELSLAIGGIEADTSIRLRWQDAYSLAAFSRPEIGLLVAQAGFERAGATWERQRTENVESVTLGLANIGLHRQRS
jgi:hypothetical protein